MTISAMPAVPSQPVDTVDLGHLLDDSRWTGYQKWLVFLTALTIVFDGIDNQLLGVSIPAINAVQTTMYALAANVYGSAMRATGIGLASGVGRSGAILSGYAGAWAIEVPRQPFLLRPDGRGHVCMLRHAGGRAAARAGEPVVPTV